MAEKKYEVIQIYFRKDKENEMKLLSQLKEMSEDRLEFSNLNSFIRFIINQYVKENYKKNEDTLVEKKPEKNNDFVETDLKRKMIENISDALDEL